MATGTLQLSRGSGGCLVSYPGRASPMGEAGKIEHITLDNLNVGSLFHAAFRNMADNYATCAARLSAQRDWTKIVLTGGLPQRCPVLRDMIVSRFDCPHRLCGVAEETLQGLLTLAMVAHGLASTVTEATALLRDQLP